MNNYDKALPRWTLREGVIVIISVVVIMFLLGPVGGILIENFGMNEMIFFFLAAVIQTGLLVGLSWYFAINKHHHSQNDLGFIPNGFYEGMPQGIRWGIFLFIIVMLLGMVVTKFYPVEPELQDFAKIILGAEKWWELLLPIIMGVILAPIGEEVYFRGFLYPTLRARFGVMGGILLTALFFSAMHFDLYRLIPIAVGGAGLTYLYERTGNLWTNIIAHGVWNAIMIVLIFLAYRGIG